MSWHNFQLKDTLPVLWSYQQSDKFLMEEFLTYSYLQKDLWMLNEGRKYLYVIMTLAEITSADSQYVEDWAWNGTDNIYPLNQYQ
jgi:hypothetical protein